MNTVEMCQLYMLALFGRIRQARDDERGVTTAETIVLVGVALVGAAAIGVILWGKLRDGANNVEVPSPGAP